MFHISPKLGVGTKVGGGGGFSDRRIKGVSFLRNCGAASVGVLQDNLVLSTELIKIGRASCRERV